MAVGTSTVPRFTAAFKAALEARAGLAGVAITDGWPPRGAALEREWIMLGDVRGEKRPHGQNQYAQPRREDLSLEVYVSVVAPELDSQTYANERAFALMAEVEALLSENYDLEGYFTPAAGQQLVAAVVQGELVHAKITEGDTREAALKFDVAWSALLRRT